MQIAPTTKWDNLMKTILQFLSELRDNNNREWFAANKSRYLEVKDRVEQLTMRLLNGVSQFDPEAARLRPADCLYRICRDTRFSADKTPSKATQLNCNHLLCRWLKFSFIIFAQQLHNRS